MDKAPGNAGNWHQVIDSNRQSVAMSYNLHYVYSLCDAAFTEGKHCSKGIHRQTRGPARGPDGVSKLASPRSGTAGIFGPLCFGGCVEGLNIDGNGTGWCFPADFSVWQ